MKRWSIIVLVCALLIPCAFGQSSSERRANQPQNLIFYDLATSESILPLSPVSRLDEFTGLAIDETNWYTVTAVNGGTFDITEFVNGIATATTGAANDDNVEIAWPLTWRADKAVSVEARLLLADVSGTGFNFGVTDAKTEGADKLPVTFNTPTLTSNASNCAVWFMDPDTNARALAVAVKADTDGTVLGSNTLLRDGAYHVYRIDVSTDGTCRFLIDGTSVGSQATGITTTTPLTVYAGFINREGSTNVARIDYIRAWQNR